MAPELKRHFQLVIPDLAGHGESDPAEGALSLGTLLTRSNRCSMQFRGRMQPMVFAR